MQPMRGRLLSSPRLVATAGAGVAAPALSREEAAARALGITLLNAVALLHLLDLEHKLSEGMVYMAVLFILLMLGSLTLAVLLLHSGGRSVLLAPPPVSSQTRSCSRGDALTLGLRDATAFDLADQDDASQLRQTR